MKYLKAVYEAEISSCFDLDLNICDGVCSAGPMLVCTEPQFDPSRNFWVEKAGTRQVPHTTQLQGGWNSAWQKVVQGSKRMVLPTEKGNQNSMVAFSNVSTVILAKIFLTDIKIEESGIFV